MNETKEKQDHKWKFRFFILLIMNAVILLAVGLILYPFFQSTTNQLPEEALHLSNDDLALNLKTTKEEVADFINAFLHANETEFSILLEKDVSLQGDIQLLHMTFPVAANFTPNVTESGNLILSLKTITLANLNVPHRYILQYFANMMDLPEWISVIPEEELIYFNFYDMNESQTKIRIESFDLQQDHIEFSIIHDHEKEVE